MTISINNPVRVTDLPETNQEFLVWWYCGIKRNPLAPSEPKVVVAFKTGAMKTETRFLDIGITHIGLLRIGTVWQNQQQIDEKPYEEQLFQVDCDDNGWEIVNSWAPLGNGNKAWLIPRNIYPLPEREYYAQTNVVKFSVGGNSNALVIPSMEIFSRLYGSSAHVKKTLINFPMSSAINELIYPDIEIQLPDKWLVTVTKHCLNEDAVYLAHLKHDAIAYKRTDRIWHSLNETFANSQNKIGFPAVPPWFSGKAEIKVKGFWLDTTKTRFLGLQILGYSDPAGPDIYLDRENTNLSEIKTKAGGTSVLFKRTTSAIENIRLTSEVEPGRNQEVVRVLNPELEVIGDQREIIRVVRKNKEAGELRVIKTDVEVTGHSGGDEYSSNLYIQTVSIETPQKIIPSTFMNVWTALNKLVVNQVVVSVTSVDIHGNVIGSELSPNLIDLPIDGLKRNTKEERGIYNWVFLDQKNDSYRPRQVLLTRIKTSKAECYLMEIERRTGQYGKKRGSESDSYKGLVVQFDDNRSIGSWFEILLKELVLAKGVFDNALKKQSNSAKTVTFKHVSENKENMEHAVLNGLRNIGLI
ncbi:MAG: hypothetical protein Q8L79_13720 [Methylobacter sp.]|uniref:hypothetical protein n=1 Tax=Methylobacter sp. TaxID=2051955 RepID=UPI0027301567|nr:hypothetical protein [Methylobacter sp.]MDP1666165.1 hypothetical protein [Methylobacter sp.]MDP1970506.1 hypothetical protein [Methylobacter sp.]